MRHPVLLRLALGGAGLAGCIALLSGVARAAEKTDHRLRPVIVSTAVPPNLFETLAVAVKPERYIDRWERARRDASGDPRMQALITPVRSRTAAASAVSAFAAR